MLMGQPRAFTGTRVATLRLLFRDEVRRGQGGQDMLSLLSWILTGLIVGLIARALVPGKQDIGTVMTIVLGVIGA